MKKLYSVVVFTLIFALGIVAFCNGWVILSTENRMYDAAENLPEGISMAMVLGTSKNQVGGGDNQYFTSRIEAAANLYHSGKVSHLILSGDNKTKYYNEPRDMLQALLKKNVPEKNMTLDYAGYRTLDSVVRSKIVFGQDRLVIVTQKFHGYRAAFIAEYYEIDAVIFVANEPNYANTANMIIREILARTNAVLDLYFFDTQPNTLRNEEG